MTMKLCNVLVFIPTRVGYCTSACLGYAGYAQRLGVARADVLQIMATRAGIAAADSLLVCYSSLHCNSSGHHQNITGT